MSDEPKSTDVPWMQSMSGLARAMRAAADDLEAKSETGQPIDDDWVYEHQPCLRAHQFETLCEHLLQLKRNPSLHATFFAHYVDLPGDKETP